MGENKNNGEGMLSPYRVLDLTDEKGLMCGKLLGDLGADVIKIEKPGGDSARNLGPFYHDEPGVQKSLFWLAYNTSKRGITLDMETADGQKIFKRLVKSADVIIESFPPGYMERIGLGYSALEKINPGVILVSITPFGQTGPYKDYSGPDIVVWAMGGHMYTCGDNDRPPIKFSHHSQSYLHASCEAAVGAMIALYHRELTGTGQHVDVSIQATVAHATMEPTAAWDMEKVITHRGDTAENKALTQLWHCKDGYVRWSYTFGAYARRRNRPLVEFMESEGMANDFLKGFDWDAIENTKVPREVIEHLEEPTRRFFLSHNKAELYEGALKYQVMLYPVATTADIVENVQLVARGFWVELEHPELGVSIIYPGSWVKTSEVSPIISRRAPLIGEHNQDIYENELGISREELLMLREAGVI